MLAKLSLYLGCTIVEHFPVSNEIGAQRERFPALAAFKSVSRGPLLVATLTCRVPRYLAAPGLLLGAILKLREI